MRILHLIDAASPQASATTLALVRAATAAYRADHEVHLLGGTPLADAARAAGLTDAHRIPVPFGRANAGLAILAGRYRVRYAQGGAPDVVHCWTLGAFAAAGRLLPRTPRVLTLTLEPTERQRRKLARLLHRRSPAPVSLHLLHQGLADGLTAEGVTLPPRTVIAAPAFSDPFPDVPSRQDIREAWGAGADTRVVAILSDPPAAGDSLMACLALGLTAETLAAAEGGTRRRPSLRLVVHPDQARRLQAHRMMINYGIGDVILQDRDLDAPWQVLPGCDVALALGPHGAGLAARCAIAMDVPLIVENHPAVTGFLQSDETALFADQGQTKRLAHRLHQALRDPAAAQGVARRARALTEAQGADFGSRLEQMYAGSDVEMVARG